MEAHVKLYSLSYRDLRTYSVAALFAVGNIVFPQLCHLVPQGGLILLPIYFFTLIAAYKYGWRAGLLTAVLSPLANHLLFGMPALPMLPIILIKSVLLATIAGVVAGKVKRVSLLSVLLVVAGYQLIGGIAEWAMTGSLMAAVQDVRLGFPGILLQIFGGYAVLRFLLKK